MDDKELDEKLFSLEAPEMTLPAFERRLKNTLLARQYPEGNSPRSLTASLRSLFAARFHAWQPVAAVLLVLAVVLALILPPMLGEHSPVLASDIALANPRVKGALNGVAPAAIGVTDNFGSPGVSRVVMLLPPEQAIIADVDMNTKKVKQVTLQKAADIPDQQLIDTAGTDSRVQAALDEGYSFIFYRHGVYQLYTQAPDESDLIAVLKAGGSKNPDMVGFLGFLYLEKRVRIDEFSNRVEITKYDVVVNMSLGKVIVFNGPYKPSGSPWIMAPRPEDAPDRVFAEPDPDSITYEVPRAWHGSSRRTIEQTPRRIVEELKNEKGEYKFTWDISDRDIENILALASTDPGVQALMAKGARFATIEPWSSGRSFLDRATGEWIEGLQWEAIVRIDLGFICYRIRIDYSSRYAYPLVDEGRIVPSWTASRMIVLP